MSGTILHLLLIISVYGFTKLCSPILHVLHGELGKRLMFFSSVNSLSHFVSLALYLLKMLVIPFDWLPQFSNLPPLVFYVMIPAFQVTFVPFPKILTHWCFSISPGNSNLVLCKECHLACRYLSGITWRCHYSVHRSHSSTLRQQV